MRAQLLSEIAEEIKECTRCNLHQVRTNTVPGEGEPTAPLLLIGEAPGEDEDLEGRPFVGKCGQILRRMLVNSGFTPKMHFIINTIKCRPPGNDKPTLEQQLACKRFLLAQISLIQPKLIMLLGNIALNAMLKVPTGMGITKLRGQIYERYGLSFLPTVHPSYIVRGAMQESEYINDFVKAKRYLSEQGII